MSETEEWFRMLEALEDMMRNIPPASMGADIPPDAVVDLYERLCPGTKDRPWHFVGLVRGERNCCTKCIPMPKYAQTITDPSSLLDEECFIMEFEMTKITAWPARIWIGQCPRCKVVYWGTDEGIVRLLTGYESPTPDGGFPLDNFLWR